MYFPNSSSLSFVINKCNNQTTMGKCASKEKIEEYLNTFSLKFTTIIEQIDFDKYN